MTARTVPVRRLELSRCQPIRRPAPCGRAGCYRAGELTQLDDAGLEQLRALGITDVADLRSPREVERHGADLVPDGVDVHLLPFLDIVATIDGEAPHEHAFQRLMTEKPDGESCRGCGQALHGRGVHGDSPRRPARGGRYSAW